MRIHVDRDRCEGHRQCAIAAPAVYDLDEDEVVVLRVDGEDVPGPLQADAAHGADLCPVMALRVED